MIHNLAANRQTQSYLRNLFNERGLRPKSKLGQNFLIDLNLIDFVARHAELMPNDVVLEVGTGTGGLTGAIARLAAGVVSVEIDASFHALARDNLRSSSNVDLVHVDVLKNKNHLNSVVLERLQAMREAHQPHRLKLVANLPYAVATPVIANLLLSELPFERMVVTVQWEIAERLIASPNSKDYSSLAVLVQSIADLEVLRKLPPTVFWPRPQVESAIVRIMPNAKKRATISDVQAFRVFLRDLYAHRRKNLRGGLAAMPGREKPEVDALLAKLEIDGNCRAETLDLEQHRRLFEAFAGVGRAQASVER